MVCSGTNIKDQLAVDHKCEWNSCWWTPRKYAAILGPPIFYLFIYFLKRHALCNYKMAEDSDNLVDSKNESNLARSEYFNFFTLQKKIICGYC